MVNCKFTKFKNCSCLVCRKRKPAFIKKLLFYHRSKQDAMEARTSGKIPSYKTLIKWYSL